MIDKSNITTRQKYSGEDILSMSRSMQGQLNHFFLANAYSGTLELKQLNVLDIVLAQAEELKKQLILYNEYAEILRDNKP